MKKQLTYILILGGVILTALSGCQKETEDCKNPLTSTQTKFFNLNLEVLPAVRTLVNELQQTDDSLHFSNEYSRRYGSPLWEKAMVLEQQGCRVFLIPIKANGQRRLSSIWSLVYHPKNISSGFIVNNPETLDEGYRNLFDYLTDKVWPRINPNLKFTSHGALIGYEITETCWETWASLDGGATWTKTNTSCSYNIEWVDDNTGITESKLQLPRTGQEGGTSGDPTNLNTKRPLNPLEKNNVDQAKEEVKDRGCGANMAYNMVNPNWGNYKFVIDPSIKDKGNAFYDAATKTFGFLDESQITAKNLTEEIIHAAQDLIYQNGTAGRSQPNIEFEAKFLVEINGLYTGFCCDYAGLNLPGPNVMDDLKKWIANGSVNLDEYYKWVDLWCNIPHTQCNGEGSSIDRTLQPILLNKFIKESSGCLK